MSVRRITRSQATNSVADRREVELFQNLSRTLQRFAVDLNSSTESARSDSPDLDSTIINLTDSPVSMANDTLARETSPISAMGQMVTIKDALRVIPEYDGSNIPLRQFLEGCDEAREMIDPSAEKNLVKLLRCKITGEARQTIAGQSFDSLEKLREFLKSIFAPAKTVAQLLGDLGKEFQRERESVITFANRMRDLGSAVLEAERIRRGTVAESFCENIRDNVVDCFRRGLRADIEQRLLHLRDANIAELIREAVRVERELETQNNLRKNHLNNADFSRHTRKVYHCTICTSNEHDASNCGSKLQICQFCDKSGHAARECPSLPREEKCKTCHKTGHTAETCRAGLKCQYCDLPGHTAKTCFKLNGKPKTATTSAECFHCKTKGHFSVNCPQKPYRNTDECTYCGNRGHNIQNCRKRALNANRKSVNSLGRPRKNAATDPALEKDQRSDDHLLEALVGFH